MPNYLSNCSFYENDILRTNKELIIDKALISEIRESDSKDNYTNLLIPGFIDLQIYGAGGQLFSAAPSIACLSYIESALLKTGTTSFLACIATNTPEIFNACISVAKEHRKDAKNCLGLHLEGPFLNPKRRGAHVHDLIRKANLDEVKEMLDFGDGVIKMMTIAPELQDDNVINYLLDNGVIVSLGHSDATFDEATSAYDKGIQTTTHLFNAMSGLHHREPGIPTAVFNHSKAMASIIADGYHVDFEVVKISQQLLKDRMFLITDAVTACNTGPYQHVLTGDKFVMPDGTLSGSSLTMLTAVKNCVTHCGISLPEALNMSSTYPSRLIGEENLKGLVKEGFQADLLVLDNDLHLKKVIFKGNELSI